MCLDNARQRFRKDILRAAQTLDCESVLGPHAKQEQIRIRNFRLTSSGILNIIQDQDMLSPAPVRAKLSRAELQFRSRVAQIASGHWLLRGNLSERSTKCGKPNCRCARGQLHSALYLVQSQGGKPRQICVPKAWHDRVRRAVEDYHEMQRLIEEISQLEWSRLGRRQE